MNNLIEIYILYIYIVWKLLGWAINKYDTKF